MFKIPLDTIKEKIVASGKMNAEDLDNKIKAKINELSGLITEEGAAHIIANELNVALMTQADKLKIKEIYTGMRDISTTAQVVRIFDVREFAKGDKTGKVCSLIVGDETATMRLVLWNDQVDQVKDIKEGDVLAINNAYARENNSKPEIHLGNGYLDINPEGVKIVAVRQSSTFERREIGSLRDDMEQAEIVGTVVQVFDPRFFTLCPECNKRSRESGEGFTCVTHGIVQPVTSYVMNAIIDDGSGNIRTVFWKNQTNHFLNKTEEEVVLFKDNLSDFEGIKTDLLGEQFKLMGRVKKNEMFARLEFNVQLVEKASAEEELNRLEKTDSEKAELEKTV